MKYVKIFSNVPSHIDLVRQDCFDKGHDCQGNDCAVICLTCDKIILDIKHHYIVGSDNDNKCAMVCYQCKKTLAHKFGHNIVHSECGTYCETCCASFYDLPGHNL